MEGEGGEGGKREEGKRGVERKCEEAKEGL